MHWSPTCRSLQPLRDKNYRAPRLFCSEVVFRGGVAQWSSHRSFALSKPSADLLMIGRGLLFFSYNQIYAVLSALELKLFISRNNCSLMLGNGRLYGLCQKERHGLT